MKKFVLVIALAAIALSGSAFAQDPGFQNNIGIYSDEAGTTNCGPLAIGAHWNYLVLTNMTAGEVLGWEAKIIPTNLFMTSVQFRGTALNVGLREFEYLVGLDSPLPAIGGACVLADVEVLITNTNPAYIHVDEVYFSLLENGLPAYLNGASEGFTIHPANASAGDPYAGSVADPIFIANGDCGIVAVEDASFGSVKSLFR